MTRPIHMITAEEWIRWRWIDVTHVTDDRRMFACGDLRTPEESAKAKADIATVGWDEFVARSAHL